MTSALTHDDEWKAAGDSAARHYSGSRQIALPAAALEVSGLGIGDTVSLAVQEGTVRAFSLEGWTQERRIREQGASVVLPITKRVLEAAEMDTDAQEVSIEAREGEVRIRPATEQEQEVMV
jgi:antitoxin component of MazEF toxin-antitoxin module